MKQTMTQTGTLDLALIKAVNYIVNYAIIDNIIDISANYIVNYFPFARCQRAPAPLPAKET